MASGSTEALALGLRVLMRPTPGISGDDGPLVFAGSLIELSSLGDATVLQDGQELPAELVLSGFFRDRIRTPTDQETKELARLKGAIRRDSGTVTFVAEEKDGAPIGLVPTQPSPTTNVRLLTFAFQPGQFPNLPNQLLLRFEIEPQYQHLEVSVALLIAGATEAQERVNDVLDVLVTALNPPAPEGRISRFSF